MANDVSVQALELSNFRKNSDIYVAVALIGVLALMIIPLPAFLLDLFLAANITISLAILLVCLYTQHPLDFSVFPSVLLVTTLFRLALNVAGTRLILLHGTEGVDAAGAVIKAFGSFVVGGNYIVGAVMFLILVVINFVVITKGAGRVAEVSARFTLDAMPGKQMAIDADLSAGFITEKEARKRRDKVRREADFYGAMDGSSKFVRGDAVAGILIMLINIFGGLIIGVWQQGLALEVALTNYTLLTIGEGLVTQIPALIISTAAGIIVTRTADENNFGQELTGQFLSYPKAFYVVSGVMFLFALIPGLPEKWPMWWRRRLRLRRRQAQRNPRIRPLPSGLWILWNLKWVTDLFRWWMQPRMASFWSGSVPYVVSLPRRWGLLCPPYISMTTCS